MDFNKINNARCIVIVGDPNVGHLGVHDSRVNGTCTGEIKTAWSPGGVRGLLSMSYG
jgi:hypothetical protein